MKLLFTIILILMALTMAIFAQEAGIVKGKVIRNAEGVAGITVMLSNGTDTPRTTISDANGEYSFRGLPNGRYEVYVPNATTKVSRRISLKAGEMSTVDLDITIYPSAINERVTVAATQTQPIEQVSKTVDLITGQEMRDRADFSLAESLRTIPGFRVQQLGGFGKTASIKTRGLRNQDTAILIDGIRFRDASAISGDMTSFISDITLTSVSQVEVLRGPGSSLYGTNAAGGTIDFQTPTARKGTHGQIGGALGGLGLGRFRGNLSHGTPGGRFGITSGVSRTVYTKGIDGDDEAHNTNLQTRIDATPFTKNAISGRIFFSDADVKLNANPDTFGSLPPSNATIINAIRGVNFTPDANDPDNLQRSRSFTGQISVNQIISNNATLSGHYQGLSTRRQNDNGTLGVGFQSASTSIFEGRIDTVNAKLNWVTGDRNTVTAGYEFEREAFDNEGITPSGSGNFFTDAGQRSNTFFLQNLTSLNDGKLQLAGGFRIQRYNLGRPAFSIANAPYGNLTLDDPPTAYTFDGAASYYFRSTGTKVRAHVGNGYRVPSLYERFGTFFSSFGTPSFIALGDPFLKPEKTIGFDAGIDQDLADARVRLSATYFYTRLTDIIRFANVAPNIGSTIRTFGGYVNGRGGIARGSELTARFKPWTSTDISTSYTFTNSDQLTPQVSGSRITRTLGVPDHQFTVVATQRFKKFWVNFDFLATSTYLAPIFSGTSFSTYVYRFKGNRRGDVTAGYTFDLNKNGMNLRVFGTVENVFDQEYYENGFRTAKANARLGVSYSF
jgi:vitamin B12 transporter